MARITFWISIFSVVLPLPVRPQDRVLDDFSSVSAWQAVPSDGVSAQLKTDRGRKGKAMRLDFDFHGGAGYAIARRRIPLDLPENYAFSFWIRAEAPRNNLEFKIVDPSGDNVWWVNRRDFRFPTEWTRLTIRKRHIGFAWGPLGGGMPSKVAALELVVTAGTGGKGTVWIDDLTLTTMPPNPEYVGTPAVRASSSAPEQEAARAVDGDRTTGWRSGAKGERAWLALDFGRMREYGGVIIDWDGADYATAYDVETSANGRQWTKAYTVEGGNGGRDHIALPETDSRHLRLTMRASSRGRGYRLTEVAVQPIAYAESPTSFLESVARDAPRGSYPRAFLGEQSYWTIVGTGAGDGQRLLNEDGLLEAGKSSFSIEPFLRADGRLYSWSDVTTEQSLEEGYLPIPSVRWSTGLVTLTITAFAESDTAGPALYARYRVENKDSETKHATLFLAMRPFQVNPPWQFLNVPGGAAELHTLKLEDGVVVANGTRVVVPLTPADRFGAATFDQGEVIEHLRVGRLPVRATVSDPTGRASGALAYELDLAPGATRDIYLAIPFDTTRSPAAAALRWKESAVTPASRLDAARGRWKELLDRVTIQVPASAGPIGPALKANLGYILVNRSGAAIHPGSRSYDRSWIRDGSLTSAALLRLGRADAVRSYIDWFAPYQFSSGKIPCCVDSRGADPVPENDSHGEFIYLVMEYFRYTGDTAVLVEMWPRVAKTVAFIDSLRHERMTAEYQTAETMAYYGLVPQSISHEGYSAKPMHSYWDDFFTLKGLKDAAAMAAVLGKADTAVQFGAMRDEFRANLLASIERAMVKHDIDFIPGSVELGDFDATSTTIALAPGGEQATLPASALTRTFDRYYQEVVERREAPTTWEAYTPYELRTVGTFVRLGWRAWAHELLRGFFADQRPAGWRHWAEVVWREPRAAKFIGDMPHTWVGSDFIRSALDLFAYEREADDALVIAAGVSSDWVAAGGVVVRDLPTRYGPLNFTMTGDRREVRASISGNLAIPKGGLAVRSPFDTPATVRLDGKRVRPSLAGEVIVRKLPAVVVWRK
jgi:F5/8 type C domain-containing protein